MNFFFGFNNKDFFSKLSIPKFQNSGKKLSNIFLFSLEIVNEQWKILKVNTKEDNNFFYLEQDQINSHKIYFIARDNDLKKFGSSNFSELSNLNNLTDTSPEYRANFKIFNKANGFSSYQSDYPYKMTKINGSILSSLFMLTDNTADKNYILIRNIYYKPVIKKFPLYIVNIKKKKIIHKEEIKTNHTNIVDLKKEYINDENYLFTSNYIGIPLFLSEKNNHLSLEHTLPPSSYILSKDRFKKSNELKKNINEIIAQ
jgi:hypothetical protein